MNISHDLNKGSNEPNMHQSMLGRVYMPDPIDKSRRPITEYADWKKNYESVSDYKEPLLHLFGNQNPQFQQNLVSNTMHDQMQLNVMPDTLRNINCEEIQMPSSNRIDFPASYYGNQMHMFPQPNKPPIQPQLHEPFPPQLHQTQPQPTHLEIKQNPQPKLSQINHFTQVSNVSDLKTSETADTKKNKKKGKKTKKAKVRKPKKDLKLLRNSGKEYVTSKGNIVRSKEMKFVACKCRFDCKLVSKEEREDIHRQFWETANWEIQTNFIIHNVKQCPVKRKCSRPSPDNPKPKANSRKYYINGKRVCLNVFVATLDINQSRICYAFKKKKSSNVCVSLPDKRGKTTKEDAKHKKEDLNSDPLLYMFANKINKSNTGPNKGNIIDVASSHEFSSYYSNPMTSSQTNQDKESLQNIPVSQIPNVTGMSEEAKKKFLMKQKKCAKLLRNSGKAYMTSKGKVVRNKTMKINDCKCRFDCKEVTEEERKEIHEQFWACANWEIQTNFIIQNVKQIPVKRRSGNNQRPKENTRIYFLNEHRVCLRTFTSTLDINQSRVTYAFKKKRFSNSFSLPDKRGKTSSRRTTLEVKERIFAFLNKFPKYQYNYSTSSRQYFHPDLSQSQLYRTYKETELPKYVVCEKNFKKILKTYNVSFYVPKGTCQLCNSLKIKLERTINEEEKMEIQEEILQHHERAESAREMLRTLTNISKDSKSILSFTFTFQKVQSLPYINSSGLLNKRQLFFYNFGIHTLQDSQGYMCTWIETQGRKGIQEICSALLEFLSHQDLRPIDKIHTFSDGCGSQDKSRHLIAFMSWICEKKNVSQWQHTFLETGHSSLPNDYDFSLIEKKKKKALNVYTLQEWNYIIKTSQQKRPFIVYEMEGKFKDIEAFTTDRKYTNFDAVGNKFKWQNIRWLCVEKGSTYVSLKYDNNERSSVFKIPFMGMQLPNQLHPAPLTVQLSPEKYNDILSLLQHIPEIYHPFYNNLPH